MNKGRRSRSPIKKMLIKKIVSYYDTLDQSRSVSRSRSPAKQRSFKKSVITPRKKKPKFMKEKNLEYYQEVRHRNTKLDKLGELMETELHQVEVPLTQSPEKQLAESTLLGSIKRKPTAKVLKEKVVHYSEHPADPGESDIEESGTVTVRHADDIFAEKLYHLNTKKQYIHTAPGIAEKYDFHQRKSKEIRRLQYVSALGARRSSPKKKKRSAQKPKPAPQPKPQPKVEPAPEPTPEPEPVPQQQGPTIPAQEEDETIEVIVEEVKPKTKQLFYGIWVVYRNRAYEAQLCKTVIEGKEGINEDGVLEVVSGDFVRVKVCQSIYGGIDEFEGECQEKRPEDGECDFVVQSEDGFRYPILINFRNLRKVRDIEDSNCDAYGLEGDADMDNLGLEREPKANPNLDYLGRGKLTIFEDGDPANYHKAYLLTPDHNISQVMIHDLGDNELLLKSGRDEKTQEFVTLSETLKITGPNGTDGTMTVLTLKEEDDDQIPRQIYYIEQNSVLQPSELLHGEDVEIICEDGNTYRGHLDDDGLGPGFKLWLSEEQKQELGEDWIRVILDDIVDQSIEDFIDIEIFEEIITTLSRNRISGPKILYKYTVDRTTQKEEEVEEVIPVETADFGCQTQQIGLSAMGLDFIKLGIFDSSGRKMVVHVHNQEQATEDDLLFDSMKGDNESLEGASDVRIKRTQYQESTGGYGPDYNRITMQVEVDSGKSVSLENFRNVNIVKKRVRNQPNTTLAFRNPPL